LASAVDTIGRAIINFTKRPVALDCSDMPVSVVVNAPASHRAVESRVLLVTNKLQQFVPQEAYSCAKYKALYQLERCPT